MRIFERKYKGVTRVKATINLDKLTDIELDGVNEKDYPDFVDAYVAYAYSTELNRPLDDDELDDLNEQHPDFVSEQVYDYLF